LSKKAKEVTKKAPTLSKNVKEMPKNTLNLTKNPKKSQKIPKNLHFPNFPNLFIYNDLPQQLGIFAIPDKTRLLPRPLTPYCLMTYNLRI